MSTLNALVNGRIGGTVEAFKDAEFTAELVILDDDGNPLDLTGGAVALEVHAGKTRTDSPEASYAATLTAATAGHASLTVATASFNLPVGTHYAYVKFTNGSSEVFYGGDQVTITVK